MGRIRGHKRVEEHTGSIWGADGGAQTSMGGRTGGGAAAPFLGYVRFSAIASLHDRYAFRFAFESLQNPFVSLSNRLSFEPLRFGNFASLRIKEPHTPTRSADLLMLIYSLAILAQVFTRGPAAQFFECSQGGTQAVASLAGAQPSEATSVCSRRGPWHILWPFLLKSLIVHSCFLAPSSSYTS